MQCANGLRNVENPFAKPSTAGPSSRDVKLWIGHRKCESGSQHIIHRVISEKIDVLAPPFDHLLNAFFQADLGFPPDIFLDGAAVQPILAVLAEPVPGDFTKFFEGHLEPLSDLSHKVANGDWFSRPRIVDLAKGRLFRDEVDRASQVPRVNVGLPGSAAALEWQLPTGQPANHRLRNDAMEKLPRTISIGRPDDVHRKLQNFGHR